MRHKGAIIGHSAVIPLPPEIIKRIQSLSIEAAVVAFGYAIAAVGTLATVRVMTKSLTPEVYGELALCLTVATLLQYCFAGTSAAAIRFYSAASEQKQFLTYLSHAWANHNSRIILLAVVCLLSLVTLVVTNHSRLLCISAVIVCFAVTTAYSGFLTALQTAARNRTAVAINQGAIIWLRLGFAQGTIAIGGATAINVLLGFVVAGTIGLSAQTYFYKILKNKQRTTDLASLTGKSQTVWLHDMRVYAFPFMIWTIPAWLELCGDRWVLGYFCSAQDVGIYAALYTIAFLPMTLIGQCIAQFATPILFSAAGDLTNPLRVAKAYAIGRSMVRGSVLMTLVLATFCYFTGERIGALLLDPRYLSHLSLLPLFVCAAGLSTAAEFVELQLGALNRTRSLVPPKTIISLAAIPGFLVGATFFGLTGVIFVALAIKITRLLWLLLLSRPITLLGVAGG